MTKPRRRLGLVHRNLTFTYIHVKNSQVSPPSFPVVLGDFWSDVTYQACRENSPRTPLATALGCKPLLVTRVARAGLDTRLRFLLKNCWNIDNSAYNLRFSRIPIPILLRTSCCLSQIILNQFKVIKVITWFRVQFEISTSKFFKEQQHFVVFEKFTSTYVFKIAREKSCDYLLIIYTKI